MLAVSGVYRPPLSGLGAGLDRVVLHRFARTTIRTFTHRIGSAIVNLVISPDAADTGLLPKFPPWAEPEEP